MNAIKKLFGLGQGQPMDMFSNIAMNASEILVNNDVSHGGQIHGPTSPLLNQVSGQQEDPRLTRLMNEFDRKIAAHLRSREPKRAKAEEMDISLIADEAVNLLQAGGFQMDPQQTSAFRSMQAALASSMQLDGRAMTRAHKLFTHVMDQAPLESFNRLTERYGGLKDTQGRSTLLASFLAMSQVDPQFRQALQDVNLPSEGEFDGSSVDAALTTMSENLMNKLATAISGEGHNNQNVLQSLDRLSEVLAKIETDDRTFIEKQANNLLGAGDEMGRNFLSRMGERVPLESRLRVLTTMLSSEY